MTAVTTLPQGRPLTRADLASTPDDGHRYELIDGALIVTPSPSFAHQRVVMSLIRAMIDPPAELELLAAPFDIPLADDTVLQPDVVIIKRPEDAYDPGDPELVQAIEVLSPSTRLIDLNLKKTRLEQAGTASYWVVDPLEPMLIAWELRDGGYLEVARVVGEEEWTSTTPFGVTICPAALAR
ncbi:Uma2 family endonuclease [Kribbia dieselivorans]|uniref:Uma2 family endonuclease n=1 Tax=Kribbia dieselivorans TaxID=331526 RepID=UPI000838180C|nr:Uma2 family endonuclease [Kribbia dieselivorans]